MHSNLLLSTVHHHHLTQLIMARTKNTTRRATGGKGPRPQCPPPPRRPSTRSAVATDDSSDNEDDEEEGEDEEDDEEADEEKHDDERAATSTSSSPPPSQSQQRRASTAVRNAIRQQPSTNSVFAHMQTQRDLQLHYSCYVSIVKRRGKAHADDNEEWKRELLEKYTVNTHTTHAAQTLCNIAHVIAPCFPVFPCRVLPMSRHSPISSRLHGNLIRALCLLIAVRLLSSCGGGRKLCGGQRFVGADDPVHRIGRLSVC
jgi:hypothetical protein